MKRFAEEINKWLDEEVDGTTRKQCFNIEKVYNPLDSDKAPLNNYEETVVVFTPYMKERAKIAEDILKKLKASEISNQEADVRWLKIEKANEINETTIESFFDYMFSEETEINDYEILAKSSGVFLYGINKKN